MVHRRIVTLAAAVALIVLGAGVAPSRAQSVGAPSANAGELSGSWRGWFNIVGGDADRQGDLTLDIKDDATYTMAWTRKGTTSNESGAIVSNGGRVTLRNASGQQMTLVRNGDTLYGMSNYGAGGHPIQVTLRKATTSDAGPPSALPRFEPIGEGSPSAPAVNPLQTP
jgi:hypothetical protein